MNKKTSTIIIAVLAIAVIVETIIIASGKAKVVPTLENGQEAIVEFNDGTKYSATEIWNDVKGTYGLTNILSKVDTKILEEEYKDNKEIDKNVDKQIALLKTQYNV